MKTRELSQSEMKTISGGYHKDGGAGRRQRLRRSSASVSVRATYEVGYSQQDEEDDVEEVQVGIGASAEYRADD